MMGFFFGNMNVFNGIDRLFFLVTLLGAHESSLLSCRFVPSIWTVFDKHKCTLKILNKLSLSKCTNACLYNEVSNTVFLQFLLCM